jgi:5-methylcytosine-specific restriction protein A
VPRRAPIHRPPRLPRRDDGRPSSAKRGYDAAWRKVRAVVLAAQPLCVECLRQTPSRLTAATEVDHIIPHRGQSDPLFFDPANLAALCKPHHSAKTMRDTRSGVGRVKRPGRSGGQP